MSVTIDGTNGVTASASFYGQSTFTGTYTDGIVVDYTTGTGRITVGSSDGLKIRNGGTASPTDLVTVDSSGNVGIGTSSLPSNNRLTLNASSGNNGLELQNSGDANRGGRLVATGTAASGTVALNTTSSGYALTFGIDSVEKARIDSSGNLLVGTTNSDPAGRTVSSRIACVPAAGNDTMTMLQSSNSYFNLVSAFNTTSGTRYHISFRDGSTPTERGSISTNGSTTTYATSSDYRLKENIAPMTGALSVVQQLKPCTYTWKESGVESQGFIAHELQEVVPDAVIGEKDAVDTNGNPVYQGIDTSFLVATLTAAIQEQQAIIQQLQADVAALKAA